MENGKQTMKALLTATKTELQTDLTYVRNADIFVTEDERLIPSQVKFPAVGLKDGEITYSVEYQGASESAELFVKAIAYQELRKPEASIMGDTTTSQKGVLDIIADIKGSLKDNLLSGQANEVWLMSETESELLADENTAIQMKTITLRYVRYGTYS